MKLTHKELMVLMSFIGTGPVLAMTCTTSSRNISFIARGGDTNSVSSAVMNDCLATSFTSNSECRQNLACGDYLSDPYPSGSVTCFAQSKGLPFQRSGSASSVRSVADGTMMDCKANAYTSNSECDASIVCQDSRGGYAPAPSPPPYAPPSSPQPYYPPAPQPYYPPAPQPYYPPASPPYYPPVPNPGYGDRGGSCASVTLCVDKQTEVTIADGFLSVSNTKSLAHDSCPAQYDGFLVVRSSYGDESISRDDLPARFPLPGRVQSYQKQSGRDQMDGTIDNDSLRVTIRDGRDGAGVYSFTVCTAR